MSSLDFTVDCDFRRQPWGFDSGGTAYEMSANFRAVSTSSDLK